jgi:hypothetical protein
MVCLRNISIITLHKGDNDDDDDDDNNNNNNTIDFGSLLRYRCAAITATRPVIEAATDTNANVRFEALTEFDNLTWQLLSWC